MDKPREKKPRIRIVWYPESIGIIRAENWYPGYGPAEYIEHFDGY